MRCSFSGLSGRVKSYLKEDPLSGHYFVFFNRRRDYIKILYWETSGLSIWSKKLEQGTFEVPKGSEVKVELNRNRLMMILEGIKLDSVREKKRFFLVKT